MRGTSSRTEPRLAAVAGAVLGALLAGGCAGMPDSGSIGRVEPSQGAVDKNLQVRVFPVEPAKGAKPRDLLTGFLDTLTADEGYDTARKYLTDEAAAKWSPEAGIQVLSANPTVPVAQNVADTDTAMTASVPGTVVARVDGKHSYTLLETPESVYLEFAFVREKSGEWRIGKLPDGLIINETNFRNSYRQVDRFFYTVPDPSSSATSGTGAQEVLIADPIYLRRRIDPLTSAAKAVVAGPSDWLAPVARTAFPAGVTVQKVTVDDGRIARVELAGPDLGGTLLCRRMAAQLFYTLADQGKGQVERLELKGPHGNNCQVIRSDVSANGPGALAGPLAGQQYYQRADDGVLMDAHDAGDGSPVRGPLGKPQSKRPLGTVAVRRDGLQAAVISKDGQQLYSVPLADTAQALPEPVATSTARSTEKSEDGLASPSWDGRGDLWVVDRDPQNPKVLLVRGNKPVTVPVDGLQKSTVQSLKISSDGVRAAMVLRTEKGSQRLAVGLVQHGGTPNAPTARIIGLRTIAPLLTEVSSVSWAEADQLLVLGKERDRLQQLYYISTDGSQSSDGSLQGGEGMATVEAAESRAESSAQVPPPVLALQGADGKIYRLVNSQWRELVLTHRAGSFIYPG
ncbi:LpqB family beta-propeller domain-containing protein [Kitasatospora sp. NPDC088351]|uniref:LpqB family beta-propeller domain-containing protein n=1 Tax=unclassified Kitasatospora TaxID=2633591 RepID=UPI003419E9D7